MKEREEKSEEEKIHAVHFLKRGPPFCKDFLFFCWKPSLTKKVSVHLTINQTMSFFSRIISAYS